MWSIGGRNRRRFRRRCRRRTVCQKFGHGRRRFAARNRFCLRRYRRGRRLRFGLRCETAIVFRSVFAQSRVQIVNAEIVKIDQIIIGNFTDIIVVDPAEAESVDASAIKRIPDRPDYPVVQSYTFQINFQVVIFSSAIAQSLTFRI